MNGIDELNWDNVRIFLATLRASSLSKAADDLGVSRPKARRRLGGAMCGYAYCDGRR